jgi:FtsZ-binding cell division protein ZapB
MAENTSNNPTRKFDVKNALVITLTVILLVVVALFIIQRKQHTDIIQQLNNEKDSIKLELSNMLVDYDSLKTDNEALNENLLMTQNEIKSLLVEVEQVKKASYEEIMGYRDKVTTLRGIMKNLYDQIDSLNERNKELYAENLTVKKQYSNVRQKNEQLEKEKEQLEQTVKMAQILEALDLRASGLTPSNRETMRVARIQKLVVSFTLSKNLTAPRGPKPIYIRIMRPDQLLLVNAEEEVFPFEDLEIPYSAMREVNYEGQSLPVNIYWDNTGFEALVPGTYMVDVFADGYNIGSTTFVLRK